MIRTRTVDWEGNQPKRDKEEQKLSNGQQKKNETGERGDRLAKFFLYRDISGGRGKKETKTRK